jgi:hypothetical protein
VAMLASIPFIPNQTDRRRRVFKVGSLVAAYCVAVSVAVVVIIASAHR